jgi:hypothetical protein
MREPLAAVMATKAFVLRAQMIERLPEKLLGDDRRTVLIGVTEVVA